MLYPTELRAHITRYWIIRAESPSERTTLSTEHSALDGASLNRAVGLRQVEAGCNLASATNPPSVQN